MDFAFVGLMVNWIRRRNRAQILNALDTNTVTPVVDDILLRLSGAATATPARLQRARMAANAVRRVANTQAFYYLAVAAFNDNSYLNREARSFLRMITNRPDPQGQPDRGPLMKL
jgi:hypothetical protein